MALILEEVMIDKSLPAHYKSRAVAALATSLTLTQKAARIALQADSQPIEQDSLPELFITELSQDDIVEMRRSQLELDTAAGVNCPDDNEVIETVD